MTKQNRIEYLVCTLSVFVTSFIIYGFLGYISQFINGSSLQSLLFFGCLGGFGFSSIVSVIILSASFFKKRGLVFKIIAAVLWPVTFAACVYVGIFSYIPYQIYNIIKLVSLTKKEKQSQGQKSNSEET